MGELLLALLLRSRTEWSRRYPLPLSQDLIILPGGGAALPLTAQVNQIADSRLHSVPTAGQGASGGAVGTRLDVLV